MSSSPQLDPLPPRTSAPASPRLTPSCSEQHAALAPWPPVAENAWPTVSRAAGEAALGSIKQRALAPDHADTTVIEQDEDGLSAQRSHSLHFLGAHLFDILDKLEFEAGVDEQARRHFVCLALNAVASRGVPVVRIWGSLKRTGSTDELERATANLALLLDENARRARPLRFIVTLLNHQAGYGSPQPEKTLDALPRSSPWSARSLYLEGGWLLRDQGLLAERIERFSREPRIAASPYVLTWELVNELDTKRLAHAGSFVGPDVQALSQRFIAPALSLLARSMPQPIALGELRGQSSAAYESFAIATLSSLPDEVLGRLVWTSHIYLTLPRSGALRIDPAPLGKLDRDLRIARRLGLPFFIGEIGQWVDGRPPGVCVSGPPHDISALLRAVLDAPSRADVRAVLFWGEGECALSLSEPPSAPRFVRLSAGGDSADLGPDEARAREVLAAARRDARWLPSPTDR